MRASSLLSRREKKVEGLRFGVYGVRFSVEGLGSYPWVLDCATEASTIYRSPCATTTAAGAVLDNA